jgi:hypothetical protein
MDQKKQYSAPKMTEVTLKARSQLMQSSGYTGGGAFMDVTEKDHYA